MLEPLLGSRGAENVLVYIAATGDGYASEMASFFEMDIYAIQNQLDKLENGSILVSHTKGRTRIYTFNPRYAFLVELKALLQKALLFYPEDMRDRLVSKRRRPRRKGKPL